MANLFLLLSPKHFIIITVVEAYAHRRSLTAKEAAAIQRTMSASVLTDNFVADPEYIAGIDMSAPDSSGYATAAAVLLSYPKLTLIEYRIFRDKLSFPYIPGLLSFRECPLVINACEQLSIRPHLIIVDGQGIAHPRRFGLACHVGLLLDIPAIGCAKSRLCGTYETPQEYAGCYSKLTDHDEIIGVALRTKKGAKPLFVSIGHKVNLSAAISWILNTCNGFRLPEPSRLAHLAASGKM